MNTLLEYYLESEIAYYKKVKYSIFYLLHEYSNVIEYEEIYNGAISNQFHEKSKNTIMTEFKCF